MEKIALSIERPLSRDFTAKVCEQGLVVEVVSWDNGVSTSNALVFNSKELKKLRQLLLDAETMGVLPGIVH